MGQRTHHPTLWGFPSLVATGAAGEFIDTTEHRPPSKITYASKLNERGSFPADRALVPRGRAIGQEDRDGYRLRDKFGKTMLCYQCNESASVQKQRRIISCDFCEQHWHLDCLDPPMSGMPPPTRKWMCPVHASDHILVRFLSLTWRAGTRTHADPFSDSPSIDSRKRPPPSL